MNKKKVLIIVAHPDDETIFMGGTIYKNTLKENNWDLTIFSLCRKNDPDRAPKFQKVCEYYNAKCLMSDIEDETLEPVDINEMIKKITELANKEYDEIYTHGKEGEYGHIRHKEVYKAVRKIIRKKLIKAKEIFFFSYQIREAIGTDTGFDTYAYQNADKFINLNEIEFLAKKNIITNLYGFSKGSFEERNCREFESFDTRKSLRVRLLNIIKK
ncbi:MAG: PIG-L family deacetylase [Candidatus Pacearchaeota archaeon]